VISSDLACLIGNRQFRWSERTFVMGIVNVTSDSFSGDGLLRSADLSPTQVVELSVSHALALAQQGADIIDIGGESTRPGSVPVDEDTELGRVLPVIAQLRARCDLPISIDTYKATVARAALDEGADLVNDVWGLQMDPLMAPLLAQRSVPIVIMHNRSKPKDAVQQSRLGGRYIGSKYENLLQDIVSELGRQTTRALDAGIARDRIMEQNMRLLNHLDALQVLDLPILLGTSRKSFIGYTLDLPPEERVEGTIATVVLGITRGANVVRVHDVLPVVRAVRMTDAVLRAA
jgi:dihydropteroate synthase